MGRAPLAVVLGLLAFWAGLLAAGAHYPGYDWRYLTISTLLYPDRDPRGYLWGWGGLMGCALAALYAVASLRRAARARAAPARVRALRLLQLGFAAMVCCAVWPDRWLWRRGHEHLALLAFIAVGAGLIEWTLRSAGNARDARARAAVLLATSVLCAPLLLAAITQAYIAIALPGLPWVGLAWRDRGVPLYLSFALWEWVTCAVFSLDLLALCLLETHRQRDEDRPRGA